MQLSRDILESLLKELSDWLEFEDCEPVAWLVCGGVALGIQEIRTRTTRDVDVLGSWDAAAMTVICLEDFPDNVKKCIAKVVQNHPELSGLDTRWVNLGPRKLAQHGLPRGFEQRLKCVQFGKKLTIYLLDRLDLLALKLYAAADDLGSRQEVHYQDLNAMKPTYDELDAAVEWIRTLPDFQEKRLMVQDVVRSLGYDDLAYYI